MTKEEITARIEELEKANFYLEMKDRWSNADFNRSWELHNEIRKLKAMLTE